MKRFLLVCALIVPLAGCASLAQSVSGIATSLSSSTPSQVTTLAEANQAATLVTKAVDIAVQTGKLDRGTLLELQVLNNDLHTALTSLNASNKEGNSLVYAAFNAALTAFNAYATKEGIAH